MEHRVEASVHPGLLICMQSPACSFSSAYPSPASEKQGFEVHLPLPQVPFRASPTSWLLQLAFQRWMPRVKQTPLSLDITPRERVMTLASDPEISIMALCMVWVS
jgi:hypothetical protein